MLVNSNCICKNVRLGLVGTVGFVFQTALFSACGAVLELPQGTVWVESGRCMSHAERLMSEFEEQARG